MNTGQAPEILFNKNGNTIVIALPELLEYDTTEVVLMKSPIKPLEPTTFIFPGVILKALGRAYYVPVNELTLFESASPEAGDVTFQYAGTTHAIPQRELDTYTGLTEVQAREPLRETGTVTVFPGSLLRDRVGRLYYLPPGVLGTFTSFTKAVRDA
ncbi:MAG TPA: hypothetical protein VH912_26240 [Streptosporangiaceae bacterium]|jgi:hypothetical protein